MTTGFHQLVRYLRERNVKQLPRGDDNELVQYECIGCGEQFGASKVRTHECADFTGAS